MERKNFLVLAVAMGVVGVIVGGYGIYSHVAGLLSP